MKLIIGGFIMRIRHKPWAKPELESCPFYVKNPAEQKGGWTELFEIPERPLYISNFHVIQRHIR